jgi:hypothetical protein
MGQLDSTCTAPNLDDGAAFTEQAPDLLRRHQQPKRRGAGSVGSLGSLGDARVDAEQRHLRGRQRADAVLGALERYKLMHLKAKA